MSIEIAILAPLHPSVDARTTLTISPRPAGILPGSLAGVAPVRGAACKDMENFKDVAGYEGIYEVGDMGSIKSVERIVVNGARTTKVRERILKPGIHPSGHLLVALCANGKQRTCKVHRLVAAAFVGRCPAGMHCCHNDGDPANNAASNLRYDTPTGNAADRLLHGTHIKGERQNGNKLTEAQVLAIRADTRAQRTIAAEYGIHQKNVSSIQTRKTWAWL